MNDKSTAELEREAEEARARVADTAESLRSKMTPGQMVDEFTGMLSSGDAGATFRNLKAQVRDNPLPLALVGAGLAWLMLGKGQTASHRASPGRRYGERSYRAWDDEEELLPDGFTEDNPAAEIYGSRASSGGDYDEGGQDPSMVDKLSAAAHSAMSMAGEAVDTAKGAVSGAKRRAAHAGETIGRSAARGRRGFDRRAESVGKAGAQMRDTTRDLVEREPLVLAALGLAAGAAIGAVLPRTAIEDEHIGGYGRKLRHAGEDMVEKGIEEAKAVAAEVYETTKQEADRQGLTPGDDSTLAEKVTNVVKAAADKTEDAVRDRAGKKS